MVVRTEVMQETHQFSHQSHLLEVVVEELEARIEQLAKVDLEVAVVEELPVKTLASLEEQEHPDKEILEEKVMFPDRLVPVVVAQEAQDRQHLVVEMDNLGVLVVQDQLGQETE
jgi:hypothetical protein